MKVYDTLDDLGVQLVLVGNGSPVAASNFKKQIAFPGPVFSDPDGRLYYAFGCRRGWKVSFSLQGLAAAQVATQEFDADELQGDALFV
jgi:peroxiredoxin